MKYAVDLHIHSALSPCADDDMTPNNIVNMACLKQLDIIAVTDHNSAENLEAVIKCGIKAGITVVPGIEVETSEEVHLLCFFPDISKAMEMQERIYKALPSIRNREDIFGSQVLLDEFDDIRGYENRLLLTSAALSINNVFDAVKGMGGVVIPAHVDRKSYSMLSNLGSIPEELNISRLEISRECTIDRYLGENPFLSSYRFIKSSDAHSIGDMLERETFIELEEGTIECLLSVL